MKGRILSVVLAAGLLSGCASIVSKSEYAVAINSNPEQADFVITNRSGQRIHSGVTPASVTLKSSSGYFRSEAYTITFDKAGYASRTYTLSTSVDGWYFGNLLLGGIIGMLIVDPATGAMYRLPDMVDVTLSQQRVETDRDGELEIQDLVIATLDTLSAEQIARLVPL
jgi:hypothetical protein